MEIRIEKKVIGGREVLRNINLDIKEGLTLIVGSSGSGKTTLLRELVPGLSIVGETEGQVSYKGQSIKDVKAGVIGYISQNPDNQIVCDKVWHELAFGLESLGVSSSIIRNRVAEISTYLGIESWFRKDVTQLSGGQKQKLCLASVLCMNPEVIVMDEPTSMLDPIASREFWELVLRLKEELGIKFIIVEHNTDFISNYADIIYEMEEGSISRVDMCDTALTRLSMELIGERVRSVSKLKERCSNVVIRPKRAFVQHGYVLRGLRHSYEDKMVVNVSKLEIPQGVSCWIGPNGSGKTTTAKMITGFFGKKIIKNSVLLPQDVLTVFTKETVREELESINDIPEAMEEVLEGLMDKNPLDISGGEQHMVAVCKTLLKEADLYILDEPTKGMDYESSRLIENLIESQDLYRRSIVIITHDLELVSRLADYVVFMFNSEVASSGEPHDVLCNNTMYMPLVSRLWQGALRSVEVCICDS